MKPSLLFGGIAQSHAAEGIIHEHRQEQHNADN
jgi:hypothetical protein